MKINPFKCVVASCAALAVTLLAQDNPGAPRTRVLAEASLTASSLKAALHSFEVERQWQYKTVQPGAHLDTLGKAGWELVTVISTDKEQSLYFKKPVPPGPVPESPK